MKTSTLLTKAMNLIGEPERWTKGALARDKDGVPVSPHSGKASCYCAYGAIHKFYRPSTELYNAEAYIEDVASHIITSDWSLIMDASPLNDRKDTTHMDILLLFAIAIDLAKQNGD